MAGVVKEFTAQALAPLASRLEALEQRVAALPPAMDDPGPAILRLKEHLEKHIDHFDVAWAEHVSRVDTEIRSRVEALPKPQDGRSPTPEELAPLIAEAVSKAVSALPKAKDGAPGADGRDGLGFAGMVIDRQGDLIATMANGDQKSLGCVVGKDGSPGAAGKDGIDGLGFDDIAVEYDGDRTLTLKFVRGDQTKSFAFDLPLTIYRGTYKPAENYRAGDQVTYGGSQWIARRDTADKPETSDAWQLACKRGRDGKDGKDGAQGPAGAEGKAGRDLTQLGINGQKW